MTDAGFFRGTSTEQDVRFSDKDKKLLKMMKFEDCLEQKVDMHKVNFEALKPWVSEQVTKILGIEDEVVIELIFSFLENDRYPNAKKLQILVTGFLQSKPARIFIGQLWDLLLSAQGNPAKLPERFIEEKKNAIRQQKKKIEMELTMREDQRRFSPLRDGHYYSGRSADPPRSPGRKNDRRNRTELSETGVDVLKSEASSTQVDTEHTEGKSVAPTADAHTENKFKSAETESEQLEGRKGLERERESRGEYREKPRSRSRSRSRSFSPKWRRHRSRSHERERRHRYRSSPRRHQHSPEYSPDSHAHQQRGRGHHRESPRQSRPHRPQEVRHYHERPVDPPKHREHHDTSPHITQRPQHSDTQAASTHPSEHYSSATKKQSSIEVPTDGRRGHGSSKRRKVTPPPSPHHQNVPLPRQARHSHRSKKREGSVSSSSHSPPPVEKRHTRGEEIRTREKECSASSSVSSESESSPTPEKHRHTSSRHVTQSKPRVSREPVRSRRDSSPRGSARRPRKQSKHKRHHRDTHSLSESERSEHTSDNFSEVEARRKEAVRAKKLKNTLSVKKKQREREREKYTSGRSKVKVSSKRGHSEHRSVIGSKRKHSTRRVRSHDDSYDSEYMQEGGRDRAKKRHTHISPVVIKKSRHRLPPPESNTESSDSEDTSSSDSDSEWSGDRRGGDKKKSRVESSEDSSESDDSDKRERGRSSLEKHLREKVIQAMSKKRLKKNKS